MRIISGIYGGRIIQAVPTKLTRPTTDRVREAWASTMTSLLSDCTFKDIRVLDAFAGSGALGLELLSRGAEGCLFVEKNKAALSVLKANIHSLAIPHSQASICMADSLATLLPECIAASKPFSVVALDPPYSTPCTQIVGLLTSLGQADLLVKECLISYEHAAENSEDMDGLIINTPGGQLRLVSVRHKKYGTICLDYYSCG